MRHSGGCEMSGALPERPFKELFGDGEGEVCRARCTSETQRLAERTRAPHAAQHALGWGCGVRAAGMSWAALSPRAARPAAPPPPPPLPPLLSPSRAAGSANQLPALVAAAPRQQDLMRIHISRPSAGIRPDPRRRVYF